MSPHHATVRLMESSNLKIIQYITDQIELLEKHLKSVHSSPTMEKVHKLRVTIRRIRSVLLLADRDIKSLKKLAKNLGQIRDLDVAMVNARKYELDATKLVKQRRKFAKDNDEFLGKKQRKKIFKGLEDFLLEPKLNLNSFKTKMRHELLAVKGKIKDEDLHSLRITLKKVRYLFEAEGREVAYLKKVQDQLGFVHDLEVLGSYFKNDERIVKAKQRKIVAARKGITPALVRVKKGLLRAI